MSTPVSQKQAVVSAVSNVLGSSFTSGSTRVKEVLTTEQLNEIRETVFSGILSGDILFNKDTSDHKSLRRYVNGMIDNHFRKAKELNGGDKYTPVNPGKGRRDPQLVALRNLSKTYEEGSAEYVKVTGAIANREAELESERKAAATAKRRNDLMGNIDTSILPDELSDLISGS